MYTIISATNREGSHTEKVAKLYHQFLQQKGVNASMFSLKNVNVLERDDRFKTDEKDYLIPAEKFIFIMPEYNGTFPGILKAMIDNSDVKKCWWNKKALLTGVSSGRAGNLRGMDQMSDVLNHMKMTVHYNKLPISSIDKLMNDNGNIISEPTLLAIDQQLDEFIKF